jgi:hypothetical protein
MRTFKYDPKRFAELRKTMLTGSIPIIVIALAAGLYMGLRNAHSETSSVNVLLIAVPVSVFLALIAGGIGLARGVKRQRVLYESYRLTIDESGIIREQFNTPTIRIMKSDITLIAKNANRSFTIKGRNNREVIGIAGQVEDYEELEQILRQIKPFGGPAQKPLLEKYGRFAGIVTIILFAAVFLSNDKTIVTLSGILLIGLLGWSFTEVLRSKHIDARTKRGMYFVIFPIFAVLSKLALLWL